MDDNGYDSEEIVEDEYTIDDVNLDLEYYMDYLDKIIKDIWNDVICIELNNGESNILTKLNDKDYNIFYNYMEKVLKKKINI
jgi:hypothetical protein